MTPKRWVYLIIGLFLLVALVWGMASSQRFNFEKDRARMALEQEAGDMLTVTARAGN